jgi:two-component system nitrogen regulation response regulator NtrX
VPALRERPEDVLPIIRSILREARAAESEGPVAIDFEAARLLIGYEWPGNVRELRNVIERAIALCSDGVIGASHLPPPLSASADAERSSLVMSLSGSFRDARRAFERLYFSRLIDRAEGNLTRASQVAGLARGSLYRKLAELGLRDEGDDVPEEV